jgi:MFS family permease
MFRKLFNRFIGRRHYWRDIGFDELSELYINMMFRSLATSLVAIFIPIYLYQNGYEVFQILYFYMIMAGTQVFANPLVAFFIAKFGPKHSILLSYVFQAAGYMGLVWLEQTPFPVTFIALTIGLGMSFFFTAFHVDFSKVKHQEHGGKEVGWMYIMQKLGAALGPIVGGVIAYFFGSQYIFVAALVVLVAGIIPLLITSEPVKTNQKLDFSGLKVGIIKRDLISYGAFILENSVSIIVWPLFIGVVVFRDNPYVQLGGVSSLSIIASFVAARGIGRLIDKRRGRRLLSAGAVSNALLHLFRPFATGFSSVLAINLVNEVVTVAYNMPMYKGVYDAADEHPGFRIVYISAMETIGAFTRMLFYGASCLAAFYFGSSKTLFFGLFAVGAVASLVITSERFQALKP